MLAGSLTPCVDAPLPAASTTVAVEREPGSSETLTYRATVVSEVEAFVQIFLAPTPEALAADGVGVVLRSSIDGGEPVDHWPATFEDAPVQSGETRSIDFELEVTNRGPQPQAVELVVEVQVNSGRSPQPVPGEVSIAITER